MKTDAASIRISDEYQLKGRVELVLFIVNITLMIALAYGEQIFGQQAGEGIKPFAFGGLMLILGIYIAKSAAIWEKKPSPS